MERGLLISTEIAFYCYYYCYFLFLLLLLLLNYMHVVFSHPVPDEIPVAKFTPALPESFPFKKGEENARRVRSRQLWKGGLYRLAVGKKNYESRTGSRELHKDFFFFGGGG